MEMLEAIELAIITLSDRAAKAYIAADMQAHEKYEEAIMNLRSIKYTN